MTQRRVLVIVVFQYLQKWRNDVRAWDFSQCKRSVHLYPAILIFEGVDQLLPSRRMMGIA